MTDFIMPFVWQFPVWLVMFSAALLSGKKDVIVLEIGLKRPKVTSSTADRRLVSADSAVN